MGSIIAEDIPKGLEEEDYFHGLLPREDCNEILTEVLQPVKNFDCI